MKRVVKITSWARNALVCLCLLMSLTQMGCSSRSGFKPSPNQTGAVSSDITLLPNSSAPAESIGSASSASSSPVLIASSDPIISSATVTASSSSILVNAASSSSSVTFSNTPSFSSAASSTGPSSEEGGSENNPTFSATRDTQCMPSESLAANITTIFDDVNGSVEGSLTGFNQISDITQSPYDLLDGSASRYHIPGVITADETCDGAQTMRAVLVKKLGDFNAQHPNGFEANIINENKTFSDPLAIVLTLKVNSELTRLPSTADIQMNFPSLTPTEVQNLDQSQAVFSVSLLSPRSEGDRSEGSIDAVAERYIRIDSINFDRWITVRIPVNAMVFYETDRFSKEVNSRDALSSINIDTLQILAETLGDRNTDADFATFGHVVRNFPSRGFTPELFKEIDLTIKRIAIEWQ